MTLTKAELEQESWLEGFAADYQALIDQQPSCDFAPVTQVKKCAKSYMKAASKIVRDAVQGQEPTRYREAFYAMTLAHRLLANIDPDFTDGRLFQGSIDQVDNPDFWIPFAHFSKEILVQYFEDEWRFLRYSEEISPTAALYAILSMEAIRCHLLETYTYTLPTLIPPKMTADLLSAHEPGPKMLDPIPFIQSVKTLYANYEDPMREHWTMRKHAIVPLSYFLYATGSDKFSDYISGKIAPFLASRDICWWDSSLSPCLHLTLGFLQQYLNDFSSKEFRLAPFHLVHTIHHRIIGGTISQNGWITLTLSPKKRTQRIHDLFVQEGDRQKLFSSPFSGSAFMPHITIGSLTPGADRDRAAGELSQLVASIFSDPLPFVAKEVHLDATNRKETVQRIFSHVLKAKDIGVMMVSETPQGIGVPMEYFKVMRRKLRKYYAVRSPIEQLHYPTPLPVASREVRSHPTRMVTMWFDAFKFSLEQFRKVEGDYQYLQLDQEAPHML